MSRTDRNCKALLYTALLLPWVAHAGCSRPMAVALSQSGMVQVRDGDKITGFLPDMLRKFGADVGCEWVFTIVPRARAEALFEAGKTDLMFASTHSERRDLLGYFTPMISTRATVLSFGKVNPPIKSLADLVARRDVHVALVRGQEYGGGFPAAVKTLAEQGRIIYESNSINVARLLDADVASVTIMTPIAFAGLLGTDARYAPMIARLRIDPVDELPWDVTGTYISRQTVSAADRAALEDMLARIAKSTWLMDHMKQTYPANVLHESVR
jgi:polar amino acid transport system substrate-binding protein